MILKVLFIMVTLLIVYSTQHIRQGENFREASHDSQHIKEHYEGVADLDESKMTTEELEFHYFQLHDFDNNTKLDGLELFKAMSHVLPSEMIDDKAKDEIDTGKTQAQIDKEKADRMFKYIEDVVDKILEDDDLDNDGFLTYWEFVYARKKQEIQAAAEKNKKKFS